MGGLLSQRCPSISPFERYLTHAYLRLTNCPFVNVVVVRPRTRRVRISATRSTQNVRYQIDNDASKPCDCSQSAVAAEAEAARRDGTGRETRRQPAVDVQRAPSRRPSVKLLRVKRIAVNPTGDNQLPARTATLVSARNHQSRSHRHWRRQQRNSVRN